MKIHILACIVALVTLLVFDGLWLAFMTPRVYHKHLAHLFADSILVWPAVAFYVLYVFGLYFFVVRHALGRDFDVIGIFGAGVVLGIVAYGTYDLTNQATLKGWPVFITIIDIIWGGLLTGTVAVVTVWVTKRYLI
jgi:uncharacterized membrane protein